MLIFILLRNMLKIKEVKRMHVVSHDQVTYIFTKFLPTILFENLKKMIGMKDNKDLSLRDEFVKH